MKELSIEEKAQRFDEALEKAKSVIKQNPLMEYLKKGIEYIFPELAESEDEKIKKLLIEAVIQVLQDQYCSNRGVSKEKVVAWLEKQGQTFTKKDVDDAYLKGICDAKQELEKQCDHKPADKAEPKFKIGEWITIKK